MIKLSIIVPVYNVEKYLAKCLDSLLNQDLPKHEYEIVVINDGSTDSCSDILKDYTVRFPIIKLISQSNQGLGAARNTGIDAAAGQYIQFVDSDDYLETNVLKMLVSKMDNEQLDILRFNYRNVSESHQEIKLSKQAKKYVDYQDNICDGIHFLNYRLGFACYACQFIIKTELLKKPENKFKTGIYFEDTEWTPRILTQAKRVSSTSKIVYNYLLRLGSITKTVDVSKKRKILDDRILVIDSLLKLKYYRQIKNVDNWIDGMISHLVIAIFSMLSRDFYSDREDIINKLKERQLFPLSYFKKNTKQRLFIFLINTSPGFFILLKKR
jgi:glycosyltransferase involved in cell wall biosynthesis